MWWEICGGLACTLGKLKHLGFRGSPNKSTLSYANFHRPWQMFEALYTRTKGAVKLHLLLDHDGYLPVFAQLIPARVHDARIARGLCFPPGSILVVDRGYVSYALFPRWREEGVYFVTRMKVDVNYRIVKALLPMPGNGFDRTT